jgi:hypothetical protein
MCVVLAGNGASAFWAGRADALELAEILSLFREQNQLLGTPDA